MIIKGNDDLSHVYIIKRFDKAVLIDPSHSYNDIKTQLTGYQLAFILLTHGHIDHTALIGEFNCPIYMHKDDYELSQNDDQNGSKDIKLRRQFDLKKLDVRFITDLAEIDFTDEKIKVYHTPGHTKGSLCYLYRKQLFTGDTLFKDGVGRTDLIGGSTASLNKSLKRLFKDLPQNITILPGHDDQSTLKDELKQNTYIQKIISK
jgi:glyoxylase-like metal-dependent hydrolase (beta-lactamase superfamily II)